MIFMAIAVVADIGATFLLTADQIPLVTNVVIYGYLVGAVVVSALPFVTPWGFCQF